MEKIIKRQIGKEVHTFMVQGDNFFDVMMESKKLSFGDVTHCECGSQNIFLDCHITEKKKFKYVTIRCKDCKKSVNFGCQMQNPDIYYIKMRETSEKDKNGKPKKVLDWRSAEDQEND